MVVVAAAFAKVAADNTGELRDVDVHLRPGWFLLAAPAGLASGPLLPLAWRQVLRATGHRITGPQAVRVWYLGQTARYLPTGLVAVASRSVLLARHGVAQAVTVATVVVELLLIVTVGGGLAAVCLPSTELAGPARVLLAAGALGALVVGPHLVRLASGRVARLDPHRAGGWAVGSLYRAELLFLVNAVAKSLAFVLFACAIQPVGLDDVLLLVGAFNAANTLGTVGITPAGLGVREGVMAALLADRYGLGDGATLAVAARVWDTALELVWLTVVQRRSFRADGPPSGADPALPAEPDGGG